MFKNFLLQNSFQIISCLAGDLMSQAISQDQAKLQLVISQVEVEKLDAHIRPTSANPGHIMIY